MKATIWSRQQCTFCDQAKSLLTQINIPFEERVIGEEWTKEQLLEVVPTARTVPQIFLNEKYVGGYNELTHYLKDNKWIF